LSLDYELHGCILRTERLPAPEREVAVDVDLPRESVFDGPAAARSTDGVQLYVCPFGEPGCLVDPECLEKQVVGVPALQLRVVFPLPLLPHRRDGAFTKGARRLHENAIE
jgi:hypothetical protein